MLEAINLKAQISERILFDNLSFKIEAGTITYITGANGSGKSTLLNILGGIRKPTSGQIFFNNFELYSYSPKERAKMFSSISQFDESPPDMLVEHRIATGLVSTLGVAKLFSAEAKKNVYEMAEQMHITNLLGQPLSQLSGGEKKKVHLARCFINREAKILLLDEPFAGIDAAYQLFLENQIEELAQKNTALILSTHLVVNNF